MTQQVGDVAKAIADSAASAHAQAVRSYSNSIESLEEKKYKVIREHRKARKEDDYSSDEDGVDFKDRIRKIEESIEFQTTELAKLRAKG